jgi:hypothetical protein
VTKSERIMRLWAKLKDSPKKTTVIAEKVGCDPAYVRVVARQRKGSTRSEIDRRWLDNGGREWIAARYRERYHNDPKFRAKQDAKSAAYRRHRYHTDPEFRAREAERSRARYWSKRAAMLEAAE